MRNALRRVLPRRIKAYVKAVELLLVYFGFISPTKRGETKGDEILTAVLAVQQDLATHKCPAAPFPEDLAFVQRLCDIYQRQKVYQPPEPYRLGKIWDAVLLKWRTKYLSTLEAGSANELLRVLQCFHRNDALTSVGVDIDALFEIFSRPFRSACFVTNLITRYQAFSRVADDRFLRYLDESDVGCPVTVPFEGRRLSVNSIRHAYYASELSRAASLDRKQGFILVEIGAGYGNLARILKSVYGAKTFTYVILDLPKMLPLVSYFLRANFPQHRFGLWDELMNAPLSRSDLLGYDFVLLPNWDIKRLSDLGIDAVINTASLAEMDPDIVQNYLQQVQRIVCPGGHFYTVNRNRGVSYELLGGEIETGMNLWNLGWPGWSRIVDRPSWGDLHWGAWERVDYREVVMERNEIRAEP